MKNEKVSEKNWLHTASATAKRFSSTLCRWAVVRKYLVRFCYRNRLKRRL